VLVVGDTPHDVACAHAVGAVAVAVATGGYSVDRLRETGADYVFRDLSDTEAFLKLLRS
jgi:phosphoglycolate phosphatase-like HAD superfamily hydrolase